MTEARASDRPRVFLAPAGAAPALSEVLGDVEPTPEALPAQAPELREGPLALAGSLRELERQAIELEPDAALVGAEGDEALAAVVSLVKLGIPVIRVREPGGAGEQDLPGLLADHEVEVGENAAAQVAAWLRPILPGR